MSKHLASFRDIIIAYNLSIAKQNPHRYATKWAKQMYANSPLQSKNELEDYFNYALRSHQESIKLIRNLSPAERKRVSALA